MSRVVTRRNQALVAERQGYRWRADIAHHDLVEAQRALIRTRMRELATRLRNGSSIDRVSDLRDLDGLWREVETWS